jgi:hypothetical protein
MWSKGFVKHPRNARLDSAIQAFVGYKDRVQNISTFLGLSNNLLHNTTHSISKNFSKNTTYEANRPEVCEINHRRSFGD